jgi:hypothetical protein
MPSSLSAEGICVLPEKYGYSGMNKLLEDCDSLDMFADAPPTAHRRLASSVTVSE